jgi:signal transduction histidine kinase
MIQNALQKMIKKLESRLYAALGIALALMIAFALALNFVLCEQSAKQISALIKRSVVKDFREAVYTLQEASLGRFKAVAYLDAGGKPVFVLPTTYSIVTGLDPGFGHSLLRGSFRNSIYFDSNNSQQMGSVFFEYNRFDLAGWALAVWGMFALIMLPFSKLMKRRLIESYHRDIAQSKERSQIELARRVRHDIASPLGALQILTNALTDISEDQKSLISSATTRIGDIVDELDQIWNPGSIINSGVNRLRARPLIVGIEEIVNEKRVRLGSKNEIQILVTCAADERDISCRLIEHEFKRCLSNVIDNSIEACGQRGLIEIKIITRESFAIIEVIDNGAGIDPSHIDSIGQKGFSKNKINGSGLGVYYTKMWMEAWGGGIDIFSVNGETRFHMRLPKVRASELSHLLVDRQSRLE